MTRPEGDSCQIYVPADPALRAAGHPRRLHQTGEGLPARDHLHRGAEAAPHPAVLRRQVGEGGFFFPK